ncbi:TlpA disulfide reductase family protein [Parapedobacter sp. DT-150]|uniref:TlpA disulfide reductase family protein n=1 Tax=Parapedobacter sp. DT-150 TaxID=3396162 RepID=UPI003F1C6A8E
MKQNLRLGVYYALTKHILKHLDIRHISLLAVVSFMCAEAHAQRPEPSGPVLSGISSDSIKPLQIGDTIPEALWHLPLQVVNHPERKDTITLNDYRDKKLIILDFWATWCKPCLESLNKLDAIRDSAFQAELAVIPVQAFDSERRAVAFMEKHQWTRYSIVNDPALHGIAFSRYVTAFGTVWIHEGKLLAIPQYEDITAENIAKVINGEHVDMENQPEQPIANN